MHNFYTIAILFNLCVGAIHELPLRFYAEERISHGSFRIAIYADSVKSTISKAFPKILSNFQSTSITRRAKLYYILQSCHNPPLIFNVSSMDFNLIKGRIPRPLGH
ncbi:hypothetical protein TUMEXPCC7403_11295 [Tumidithrix helvetica PCC 7403]